MCTAAHIKSPRPLMGRNLDLEYHYSEAITLTPRNFPIHYRMGTSQNNHYSFLGVATVEENFPLYYDAVNEKGLSMAGLNFPGNAHYGIDVGKSHSISPFELIPWVLSQCDSIKQAVKLLESTQLSCIPFSEKYPLTDLHWFLCDRSDCVVIEPAENGLKIYLNDLGVLTNNPPFPYHLWNVSNYMTLSRNEPKNLLSPHIPLTVYSRGMGAVGLPGDLSSASRFVRGVFTLQNSIFPEEKEGAVNQTFHILRAVAQQEGCVAVGEGYEKTVYSICCDLMDFVYYYTTYESAQIRKIAPSEEQMTANRLFTHPLNRNYDFLFTNLS